MTTSFKHLENWLNSSYLYRLVGIFSPWREGATLLQWGDALGAFLVSLVLALGPFVSTTLIGILLITVALFWLLLTLSDSQKPPFTSIHILVLLYWAIATVATAFSPAKSAAIEGLSKLTLYLIMFALCARVLRNAKILSGVVTIFLLVALIVSVYGVRQQFIGVEQLATWNDPNSVLAQDTRVYSYLGNPNLLAAYLLPAVSLSLAAVFVWRSIIAKALAIIMVIINSSCLYFTDSRGGWIGLVVLLATFALLLRLKWRDYLPHWARLWLIPIVGGVMVATLLIALALVEPLRLRFMSIFAWRGDSSNNFRINVWTTVLEMIRDHPIIGIGPGNDVFNKIYPLYMRPNYPALSAYSIFLEITLETGLIGIACFLSLIFASFKQGITQLKQNPTTGFWIIGAIAGMAGLIAHGMVDTVWYRPQINTLWWLMVAIVASQYRTKENPTQEIS